jgi:hypothetical protein
LFLGISTLVLDYVEGNSLSRNLEFILIVVPLIIIGGFSFLGCYFGIQGLRFKEDKRLRSVLSLVGNFLFALMICFVLILALLPKQDELVESPELPIPEEVIVE